MEGKGQQFAYVGALTVAIVATALLSRRLAILLALGPSAYFLARLPAEWEITAMDVLVSHLAAVVAGWIAYVLLAQGIDLTAVAPRSIDSLRIVGSMILAMGLTAIVLVRVTARITTAHVTATVVALGLVSSPFALTSLVFCVGAVSGLHAVFIDRDDHTGTTPR